MQSMLPAVSWRATANESPVSTREVSTFVADGNSLELATVAGVADLAARRRAGSSAAGGVVAAAFLPPRRWRAPASPNGKVVCAAMGRR